MAEDSLNIGEDDDKESMTFWDHLEAFRGVLFRVSIALVICLIGCFIAMPYVFNTYILAPTTSDFFVYKWLSVIKGDGIWLPDFSSDTFHVDLININVASQFMTQITTSFWLAVVLIFPFILYQLWGFVKPALYKNERKSVATAFAGGALMFYLGCMVGYFLVFPFTFRFLSQYQLSENISNQISLDSYMGNFLMLVMVMGIVFELPLLAWILGHLGLLNKELLCKYRRHAVVVLLILAAIITPTSDPFTLLVVFLPLYLLYELSIKCIPNANAK